MVAHSPKGIKNNEHSGGNMVTTLIGIGCWVICVLCACIAIGTTNRRTSSKTTVSQRNLRQNRTPCRTRRHEMPQRISVAELKDRLAAEHRASPPVSPTG